MTQGVASAFQGETHTIGGYPRTVEACNRYIYLSYIYIGESKSHTGQIKVNLYIYIYIFN